MPTKSKYAGDQRREFGIFLFSAGATILVFIASVYMVGFTETRALQREEMVAQGRALYNSIIMTRFWNAEHGGVYVVKRPGVESSPFIKIPDIKAADGRSLTLRNPAMMTREISEISARRGLFTFRITSLKPINPGNAPDAFERRALESFEKGQPEATALQHSEAGQTTFRYMAPLAVEAECLPCHADQGYRLGDVRGGISVSFDVSHMLSEHHRNAMNMAALVAGLVGLLMVLFFIYTKRLMNRLGESRQRLEDLALRDGLTGIYNRRHLLERFEEAFSEASRLNMPLGCIMFDIDHFKNINDTRGHLAGDYALQQITDRVGASLRKYDVFGRYGGEEFLIVLPGAEMPEVEATAEKVRVLVAGAPIDMDGGFTLTVSLGATAICPEDRAIDNMLERADYALYRAKQAGRNRVDKEGCGQGHI